MRVAPPRSKPLPLNREEWERIVRAFKPEWDDARVEAEMKAFIRGRDTWYRRGGRDYH